MELILGTKGKRWEETGLNKLDNRDDSKVNRTWLWGKRTSKKPLEVSWNCQKVQGKTFLKNVSEK